jgi:hypothetical protein
VWLPPAGGLPRTRAVSNRYVDPVNGDPNTIWIEAEATPAQDLLFSALRTAGFTFRSNIVPMSFDVSLSREGLLGILMQFKPQRAAVTRCQLFGQTTEAGRSALLAVRAYLDL